MYSETMITDSERGAEQLTGILLGASVFLMLAHIAADVTLGYGRISTILILLYGIPAGLAGSALYITFRRRHRALAMFGGLLFAGHGLLIVLTAVFLLAGLQFPESFALYGAEPQSPSGAASLLELTMDKTGKAAYALLGLGLSLVGVVILLNRAAPRWIGWMGLAVGTAGFFASLAGLTDILDRRTTELVMGVPILLGLAFMAILGLRLVQRKSGQVRGQYTDELKPI